MIGIETDDLLGVLSNKYRRGVLLALRDRPRDRGIELPGAITTINSDPEKLKIELAHIHLPKLKTTGLIHWNQEENMVHRGPEFSEIHPLLDFIVEYKE